MNRREFLKGALAALAAAVLLRGETVEAEPEPKADDSPDVWDMLHEIDDALRKSCKALEGQRPLEWRVVMHPADWEVCRDAWAVEGIEPPEREPQDAALAPDVRPTVWLDDDDELLPPYDEMWNIARTSEVSPALKIAHDLESGRVTWFYDAGAATCGDITADPPVWDIVIWPDDDEDPHA